jgi:hypothetical protein
MDIATLEGIGPLDVVLSCIEQLQIDNNISEKEQMLLLEDCLDYVSSNNLKNLLHRKYGISYDTILDLHD